MSYVNPLHPPVSSAHRSSFSTLGVATPSPPQASQFLSPFRRRLPFIPYTPVSKWRNATGRTSQLQNPVTFDYVGYHKQGVPMRELSTKGAHALEAMIQGASDPVLVHTGLTKITLRILWPGYEHVDWSRTIELSAHAGPITRAQLGAAVSMNFGRFMEKARSEYSTSPDYQMGSTGIRFEHVILVSLCNVFEDIWQADVAVDLR